MIETGNDLTFKS